MSTQDKLDNAAEKAKGTAKEAVGKVTDNESLEAEGRRDQAAADVKQGAEKIKDALHD